MLVSIYDINGNNVVDALGANMNNSFPLDIRDPTNNGNQMFFMVIGASADSNQFTVTMSVTNVLGTFTAENMYILGFKPPETLEQLKDTNISSPTTGDLLTYQSSSNSWVNQQPASTSLANDTDVALSNPQNGDLLIYQTSSNNWVNQQPSAPTIPLSAYCELVSGTASISMTTQGDWYDVETATIVFNNNNSSFSSNVFTNPSNGLIQYQRYSTPCVMLIVVTLNASVNSVDSVALRLLWNGSEISYCQQLLNFVSPYAQISYSFTKMNTYDGSLTSPVLLKCQVQPQTLSGNTFNVNLINMSISTNAVFT